MRALYCIVLAVIGIGVIVAAGCHSTADPGPRNEHPILSGEKQMVFHSKVKNGERYTVTIPTEGNESNFTLIHVYGSAYEMGYAQGELMKDVMKDAIDDIWAYMIEMVEKALPGYLPKFLADLIATLGLDVALDLTYEFTVAYTGPHFYEEMKGISDASGADYSTLVRIHQLAGLTQGKCSMFGMWGPALKSANGLLQLRAFDWDMDGPFRDLSQVTIYHPSKQGHSFLSIGMTGFIGGLTGLSSTQLGISEIGVSYPDESFGKESRIGLPFIFLLRDILQFDYTLDDATSRMASSKRTCNLLLGVGDGKMRAFRGYQYSASVLHEYNDMNLNPHTSWHPRINHTVYWGMDWICPAYDIILSKQIQANWGNIDAEVAIRDICAVEQSGDNHIALYDLVDMQLYLSFAAPKTTPGTIPAYARQFVHFDVFPLLNHTL